MNPGPNMWVEGVVGSRRLRRTGCVGLRLSPAPVFEFTETKVMLTERNGTYSRQAGAHPDFSFNPAPPRAPRSRCATSKSLPPGMGWKPDAVRHLLDFGNVRLRNAKPEAQIGKVEILTG